MPTTKNALTAGWKGTFGKQIVFRQRNGETIASSYPDMSKRVLSPKQVKINDLMKQANRHVQVVLSDEQSRNEAQVRLNVPRNKLYTALIREYYQNHYRASENGNELADEQARITGTSPEAQATYDFVKYLLVNTTKSLEEISRITKTPAHFVSALHDAFRKPKEEVDLLKAFNESREAGY